jgi:uncharacterized membrane protein YhaH (DUF805 family)
VVLTGAKISHRMRDQPAASKLPVVFVVFRAVVGFAQDIALGAQRFSDAGKPSIFGGRTNAPHI